MLTDKSSDLSNHRTLRVVHVDDELFELERMAAALEQNSLSYSFKVESLDSVEKFRERLTKGECPDIVILDIHIDTFLKGGVSLVDETRKYFPHVVILMCSAMDDVPTIVECLNHGADDFLSKKSDKRELSLRVQNSYKLAQLKRGFSPQENNTQVVFEHPLPAYVGMTLERIARRIPQVIHSAISAIHIAGESGTGKEMVADLFASQLPPGVPFVKVNCGAIAPTLLESELFGHVKGSFTGALTDKKGLIESASGGWIFLDEVATLSPSAQVALLRVIENQELLKVGSTTPRTIQVRVLSATNESLPQMVRAEKFRKDLWQRLCETEIELSPLRERPNEIEALVRHFCSTMPGGPYQISEPALEVLASCPWKQGNIRELRNCLRAMTEFHVNKLLTPLSIPERVWKNLEDSPEAFLEDQKRQHQAESPNNKESCNPISNSKDILISIDLSQDISYDLLSEKLLLELVRRLAQKKGKLSLRQLSKTIGVSRSTLSGRLKELIQHELIDFEELSTLVGMQK